MHHSGHKTDLNTTGIDGVADAHFRRGDKLPSRLYCAEQVRELDRLAIKEQNIAGFTLMRRAGRAAFNVLLACWPKLKTTEPLTIVCGGGNNAGDGYIMANLARQFGVAVTVVQVGSETGFKGDVQLAHARAMQDRVSIVPFSMALKVEEGVVVDALLGTGLTGLVREVQAQAITWINQLSLPVLAVDIPSGLCSDTGQILGVAVNADVTVSFIGLKQGLLTATGPDVAGDIYFDNLSVDESIYDKVTPDSERLHLAVELSNLIERPTTAHKGAFGHVMVVGGDNGMAGAALMASEAAARCGAGLVSCATKPEHISAFISRCPEIMAKAVSSGQELEPLLQACSVLVVGPGLGIGSWGEQLLQQAYQTDKVMVVDADALNILSAGRVIQSPHRNNWILTPHPAEAARLLACTTAEVQQDRFSAARALQQIYGGTIILKGAGSLVVGDDCSVAVCCYGNPGMASGGMGDVLSGVLAALLAQGMPINAAARLAVCMHGCAGDIAARQGMCGTMATDLMPVLRQLINGGL